MSYFSKFEQNVQESASNSSSANLDAGATFTGTLDSTLGVAGIQVSLFTDQNCTVYVEQSPNDTPNWDISDSYNYYADTNFGITIQAINYYVRVRVTNNNTATATTYFRLQTILCPIVEVVPRSLDPDGHLQTVIHAMKDDYGFPIENTPMGEMRTITPIRLVGSSFDGSVLDPNFWSTSLANSGTAVSANAEVVLSTNTTANGSSKVYSFRRARYISGSSMGYRGIIQMSAGNTDNKRRWGITFGATMPTFTDGAYFELDGTTLSIVTMKNSSETRISTGSFNGVLGKTYAIAANTVKTFEIYWTNSKVYFVISDKILHTVSATSTTWSSTMSYYIYMDNVNSNGIISNNTLSCRVASIRRLGSLISQSTSKFQSGITAGNICKYGPGNLHQIIISSVSSGAVITIYDNIAASGTILWSGTVTFGPQGGSNLYSLDFKGIPFYYGLTLVIATQTANVMLIYE